MTVIAYCKGIMACDSMWGDDNDMLLTRRTKLTRLSSGAIIGEAGDDDSRHVIELLSKVKTPAGLPSREALLKLAIDYDAVLVFPSGRIFSISIGAPEHGERDYWTAGLFEVSESYYAVGHGAAHAFTAMECGKSAHDAIRLACRRDLMCREPIHMMHLIPPAKTKSKSKAKGKK
jgi:hypothetical protein